MGPCYGSFGAVRSEAPPPEAPSARTCSACCGPPFSQPEELRKNPRNVRLSIFIHLRHRHCKIRCRQPTAAPMRRTARRPMSRRPSAAGIEERTPSLRTEKNSEFRPPFPVPAELERGSAPPAGAAERLYFTSCKFTFLSVNEKVVPAPTSLRTEICSP